MMQTVPDLALVVVLAHNDGLPIRLPHVRALVPSNRITVHIYLTQPEHHLPLIRRRFLGVLIVDG